jgi:hypothetical protein
MKKLAPFLLLLLSSVPHYGAGDDAGRAAAAFFENEVRPILANRCFECHGEKKQKGGLRVDQLAYLKTGGDTGPALVPGKPEESPLIEAVRYLKKDFQMPPKEKLPEKEVAVLEKWVQLGAPWPESNASKVVTMEGGFTPEQRNFWCFQPLSNPQPPMVQGEWARTDIDRFVAAKHAELGFRPARRADAHELLRRLTFDLHGLPPSEEQVKAFAEDQSPAGYERFVDALLASPLYGERWAQHWLDLVRYAESDGYNADEYRPAVWPYRDWVIQSLNADKPYDRFVREQLAGDEMDAGNPGVLIATSYLRNPIYEWNQVDVRSQWDIILTDITDTTGEVFLGLSFGCARCHNHKFDPILQKDYFRLRAFFAPVQWRDDLKLATDAEKAEHARKQGEWEAATAEVRGKLDALLGPMIDKSVARATRRFNDEFQAMMRKDEEQRDPLERQLSNLCMRQLTRARRTFDPAKSLKSDADKARYAELSEELKKHEHLKPAPLMEAFVATDVGPQAPPTRFKTRKGEQEVAPGFLTLLEPGEPAIDPVGNSTGRRTALANWITRPDNQLSTRVIVNRVWQYHFGRGLVATSSDFGKLGEAPSHPELLDWLARRFVADGWSLKKLHKAILLSAAYQQTSRTSADDPALKSDPGNKYLWRFSPRRLDAEQVRDAMLFTSGELDFTAGGPAVDGNLLRRSVYAIKKRNSQNELLRNLDAPSGFSSTSERQSTTTPTQALFLLNGDWPLNRARKVASKVKTIDEAWNAVLGRQPTAGERANAEAFLNKRLAGTGWKEPSPVERSLEAGAFHEKTEQERLIAKNAPKEGDDFTVEAVLRLDSIDAAAGVRTIASRWSGGKDSIEAFGWSLGVTGEKSRFKPRNLIMQLVGEDENSNIGFEIVASNLRIVSGHRHHVVAVVSCSERCVRFSVRDLDDPSGAIQKAEVPHAIRSKLGAGVSGLTVGGLAKRVTSQLWDGVIEALRVVPGEVAVADRSADFGAWKTAPVQWIASAGVGAAWDWNGEGKAVEGGDAFRQAMNDVCQVLMNSNEFLYLH